MTSIPKKLALLLDDYDGGLLPHDLQIEMAQFLIYCDLYNYSYIYLTDEQIEEALGDYVEKHKLKDNLGEEA